MSSKIKCPVCSVEYDTRGFPLHLAHKHPDEFARSYAHLSGGSASLEDSGKLKAEVATLQDSLKTKDTDLATLHDEVARLSTTDHENDVVRERLQELSREGYVLLGEQLGYVQEQATVEDSKPDSAQDRAEEARDTHNVEVAGSNPAPATKPETATATVQDASKGIFTLDPGSKGVKVGDSVEIHDKALPSATEPKLEVATANGVPKETETPGQKWWRELKERESK